MLSDSQINYFRTFGFLVLRDYLEQHEIVQLRKEFHAAMRVSYVGNEFDGTQRHWIPMLGPVTPTFARLAGDPRFLEGGQDLSGGETVLFTVDANRYVGDTSWHSDGAPEHSVKFVFYLDPVGAESGALRVIPLSHRATPHYADTGWVPELKAGVQNAAAEANAAEDYRRLPAVPLESRPGDVVVFNPHIFHAAIGGAHGRAMCTVTYFPLPNSGEPCGTQVTAAQRENMSVLGATDVSHVFDLDWFASQDWGAGHAHVIANLRRTGSLPEAEAVPSM